MDGESLRHDDIAVVGVVYDGSLDVDAVLAVAVESLRSQGVRVAGLLQRFGDVLPGGKRSMYVEDLSSGELIRLDLPRGPGASGCTLDPDGLARAASALRQAVRARPDLLMVNRFGKQEAEGHGLRAELAEAVCNRLPTVVAVPQSLTAEWEKFIGAPGHLIPPSASEIVNWFSRRSRPADAIGERG